MRLYGRGVDAMGELLDGPRARGAFLLRCVMEPPWAVRIQDEAPLSFMAVARGETWVVPEGGEPVLLRPGDVALARGPQPYTVGDDPGTEPLAIIDPGQVCRTADGVDLAQAMDLGVRTWGNDLDGSTVVLTGSYEAATTVGWRLLAALPALVVMHRTDWDHPLVDYLAHEMARDEPGQEVVLDRLLDLLVIAVLRDWFARPEAEAPAWWAAQADPVVGRALRMLQNAPAHPWTVAELARAVGLSRAALARRFSELVGEPPMTFLTGWRLALAADLLREPDATVTAIAARVGYGTPFALSAAFKRHHGVSPQEHRRRVTTRSA